MEQSFIKELQTIVGGQYTLTDRESLAVYGYDSTPEIESLPGAVLLPGAPEEIARIMRQSLPSEGSGHCSDHAERRDGA